MLRGHLQWCAHTWISPRNSLEGHNARIDICLNYARPTKSKEAEHSLKTSIITHKSQSSQVIPLSKTSVTNNHKADSHPKTRLTDQNARPPIPSTAPYQKEPKSPSTPSYHSVPPLNQQGKPAPASSNHPSSSATRSATSQHTPHTAYHSCVDSCARATA